MRKVIRTGVLCFTYCKDVLDDVDDGSKRNTDHAYFIVGQEAGKGLFQDRRRGENSVHGRAVHLRRCVGSKGKIELMKGQSAGRKDLRARNRGASAG